MNRYWTIPLVSMFLLLATQTFADQHRLCRFIETERIEVTDSWEGLVVGDFNGDGIQDLASGGGSSFTIFLGSGDGTFVMGSQTLLEPYFKFINFALFDGLLSPGDIDGDGDIDLAVGVAGVDFSGDVLESSRFCFNDGTGSFTQSLGPDLTNAAYYSGTPGCTGALRDFDNDGDVDALWIVGNSFMEPTGVWLSRNDGSGSFDTSLVSGVTSGARTVNRFSLADFNNDGLLDFAYPTIAADARVFINNGGNFTATSFNPTGGFEDSLATAAGDLDGDGDVDIPFVFAGSTNEVIRLDNNGDGTFEPGPVVPGTVGARLIAVADFDGDSKEDVAAFFNDSCRILLNEGNDEFSVAAEFPVPSLIQSHVVSDFNGDQRPDIAFLSTNFADDTGNITVFLQDSCFLPGDVNGDGTVNLLDVQPFTNALSSGTYTDAADVNQDGVLDLLDVQPFVDILNGECPSNDPPELTDIVVDGTPGNDLMEVTLDGTELTVLVNGVTENFSDVGTLTVNAIGGNDEINVTTNSNQSVTVFAGTGDDTIVINGTGACTVFGGGGVDYIEGGDGDDTLNGGLDDDEIRGGNGDDMLQGGGGADRLYGDSGNDTLRGGLGNDWMFGLSGDDFLSGEGGFDICDGGDGFDAADSTCEVEFDIEN